MIFILKEYRAMGIMKIKKVIYFVYAPFCQRDYKRFGIEIMNNNGFLVEVWEFTPIIYPAAYQAVKPIDSIDISKRSCYKIYLRKIEAKQAIANLKKDTIIISIAPGYSFKTYFIYKELSKANISYCFFCSNAIPTYTKIKELYSGINKRSIDYFYNKLNSINLQRISEFIFKNISHYYLPIEFSKFIFAGGSQSILNYNIPRSVDTKIVWCHTLDYDLYLDNIKAGFKKKLKSDKYVVFIDGYMPFHPDYFFSNIKPLITPEIYYSILCNFFKYVEEKTGLKVIIAAHPRSKYEEHPDYFESREVIRGETRDLIRGCEFVLTHYSTSLNFAVLYKKPVIFITTNDLERSTIDANIIYSYSWEFKKTAYNIEQNYDIDWNKELIINEKTYNNYKEKYIKKNGSKEEYFWQIAADEIKKVRFF
jgi:hypothetical protein